MNKMVYLKNVTTLRLDPENCIGCGIFAEVCPHEVLTFSEGKIRIANRDACMECGACSRNCPVQAVRVKSGVGCAAAVINAALGRKNTGCCCIVEEEEESSPNRTCC
jgi:ferredoxin